MATAALERPKDRIEELGIKLISADNHINEPRNLFIDRFPAHLKDKAPRVIDGKDGGEGWSIDGTPPKRTYGLECMAGFDKSEYRMSGLRHADLRPGNYDGAAHLADMAIDGVFASVTYPGFSPSFYTHPDPEVAAAGFVAYNDWILDDFQSADPKRLCGLTINPTELGIEHAVAEMRRVAKKGARAMYIPGNPTIPYNHPTHYHPVWQAADELGLTLCMHRNHGGPPDATDWDRLQEDKVSIGGIVTRYFSCLKPFSYLIFAGIFDQYPNLKMVGAEVDCGWAPFWVQTMEHHWDIQKSWFPVKLKHSPTEFIGRNVFTTNVDDYCGYQMIETGRWPWMASMTMFSSDYPHSATIWPHSRDVALKMTDALTVEDTRKTLSENAARVFGFDIG
ncbi:amidohydrolase family protein [Novosphingobium sp. AP12]|uniref:amidohydrolase family protein n=1 Tax=Novosphingobium sp. AP12 TaxID=1144305 RepID=UPI000271E74C|nr:amidohydrolase family protein [Novosphingobium sp. AP12]EJL31316.1 putative TIM-barrel fold metal-dependent hydrolase [Novosphingobium sp. AP12]